MGKPKLSPNNLVETASKAILNRYHRQTQLPSLPHKEIKPTKASNPLFGAFVFSETDYNASPVISNTVIHSIERTLL